MTARTLDVALGIALAAGVAAQASPAGAAGLNFGQPGRFTVSVPVPRAAGSLPLYRLARTNAPSGFVAGVLRSSGMTALSVEGRRLVARDADGVMHAYTDPARGEAQIFPDLTGPASPADPAAMNRTVAAVFSRGDVVPNDATTFRIGAQTPIWSTDASGSAREGTQSATAPAQLFTYVSALRYADGLPVYGIGSKATLGVGPDGSIRALVRRWEAATRAGSVATNLSQTQLVAAIRMQLTRYLAQGDAVDVKHIVPAYYDGDANYLQPIYFFMADIRDASGDLETTTGYVPFGATSEPIPALDAPARQALPSGPSEGGAQSDTSAITLGEYANDDGQTIDQGNYMLAGLQNAPAWTYGPPINRTQYVWASPSAYIGSSAQKYVNSVQVAHTPPHGDWYENTTNSNNKGFFYINNIGTGGNPGYGSAAKGKLVTWIIDSCEVAPSYYDLQYTTGNGNNAFNPWWPVFQGLHHVLAYRTMMLLGQDGFDQQFGIDAEAKVNIGSAWYNDDASWYSQYSSYTYVDTHLNLYVHYGAASLFQDTRNLKDTIYSVKKQSASSNLNNSWMGN